MFSRRRLDLLAVTGVAAATLALEIALAERKFGIFTGGFGAIKVLDTPGELLAFALGAVAAHVLLVGLGFVAVRVLDRRAPPAVVRLDFMAIVGGALTAWIVGKFEVLAYFSDAISFKLIARLGGGSLFDAFLFALSESGLMIGAAVGGILGGAFSALGSVANGAGRAAASTASGVASVTDGDAIGRQAKQLIDAALAPGDRGEPVAQRRGGVRRLGRLGAGLVGVVGHGRAPRGRKHPSRSWLRPR